MSASSVINGFTLSTPAVGRRVFVPYLQESQVVTEPETQSHQRADCDYSCGPVLTPIACLTLALDLVQVKSLVVPDARKVPEQRTH